MKCFKCHKEFGFLMNLGICPYCGLNHYKYFNIERKSSKNNIKSLNNINKTSNNDEYEDEFNDDITLNKRKIYKEKTNKIEEDNSYEEFDSYNWIDPNNKSKWEDFDDEDDE